LTLHFNMKAFTNKALARLVSVTSWAESVTSWAEFVTSGILEIFQKYWFRFGIHVGSPSAIGTLIYMYHLYSEEVTNSRFKL
jgi:hypothetical protein